MTTKALLGWEIFTLVEAKSAANLAAKPPLGEIPCGTFLRGESRFLIWVSMNIV